MKAHGTTYKNQKCYKSIIPHLQVTPTLASGLCGSSKQESFCHLESIIFLTLLTNHKSWFFSTKISYKFPKSWKTYSFSRKLISVTPFHNFHSSSQSQNKSKILIKFLQNWSGVFLILKMMILGENVNNLKVIDSLLRVIVIPLSIASLWLTLTNHQDNEIYGKLEFSNLKGLK